MSALIILVLRNAGWATVLAAVAYGLGWTSTFRNRPAILHLLWFGVLLRFIVPALVFLPILPQSEQAVSVPDAPDTLTAPFDAKQAKAAQEAWARYLKKNSPVEKNSLGMELVLIPPGRFTMGSPEAEEGRWQYETQVEVTLTKPFYIGKTEVTQAQWHAVIGTKPWRSDVSYPSHGDNFPAINISWDDAQAFCKKLSRRDNARYRLATEAEWEYACRAGTTTRFHTGDDEESLKDYEWFAKNTQRHTQLVGSKKANPFGLHDMHGNVWEWCQDVYMQEYPGGIDPMVISGGTNHTFRSGVHSIDAANFRSATRRSMHPVDVDNGLGLRVVRLTD